jgi:para-aminobenzoate synthetase
MRTLLVDNYDSYTYNLFQLMAAVYGRPPVVVRNDDDFDVTGFDAVVLSPGPGSPAHPRDVGRCRDVLLHGDVPVLGVCLGHQLIGLLSGAAVGPAPQPRHGHLTRVRHTGEELFAGLPQDFTAVRYHSLCVDTPLPAELEATAWAEDGVLMALRHRDRPWWGVQFHPESIGSDYGAELLENFRRHCVGVPAAEPVAPPPTKKPSRDTELKLLVEKIPVEADAERLFADLFGADPYAVWLDSSDGAGFSFLGAPKGRLGEVLIVDGPDSFEMLEQRLAERAMPQADLPFDFTGGYVGYFGYEAGGQGSHRAETPDSVWVFVDRLAVVDHERGCTYLLAIRDETAHAWLAEARAAVAPKRPDDPPPAAPLAEPRLARGRAHYLADIAECQRQLRTGESYEICLTTNARLPLADDPLAVYRRLRRANPAPHAAFLRLGDFAVLSSSPERFLRVDRDRRAEAKPIKGTAARSPDPVLDALLRRTLATDPKTRAENLMIVDLVRNDLGRVCETGTVTVEKLMAVESYATVHQLVSTVEGRLRPEVSAVACARACFPAGSMTGAPKVRTMEIIDRLEGAARGVYSGALGYFSVSGPADLSVVIRTLVLHDGEATVGAGGAIVLDSDPVAEYEEMLLKLHSVLGSVDVQHDDRGVVASAGRERVGEE